MAQPHTPSGQVVSILPLGEGLRHARTTAILKSEQLEVARIVLPAGKVFAEHKTPGELTVQCIEGRIEFQTPAAVQVLAPGDLIHLPREEPHALRALTDASALLTLCVAVPRR